ncbi:hypothetical protein [Dyella lipolytica]|uniref:Uncharacterized protein n=1 Tax=Dyella lipolytica TaxID=1867835 RepID=A0ABW8ITS2_9GAMM|nr:hypothetical protein [Dyella lipolytica]
MNKRKSSTTEQNFGDVFAEGSVVSHRYLYVTHKAERAHAKKTLNKFGSSC